MTKRLLACLTLALAGALACACCRASDSGSAAAPGPQAPLLSPTSAAPSAAPHASAELTAGSKQSIPVHPEARSPQVSLRLPDRTRVQILEQDERGRWFRIATESGQSGWITRRYLAQPPPRPSSSAPIPDQSVWSSRQACESIVGSGQRSAASPDTVRLASWNVRWFPYGAAGGPVANKRLDLAWLACAITWLNVDALALQEVLINDDGRQAMTQLIERLNALTQGDWYAAFDECPGERRQHVGLLVNRRKVTAEHMGSFTMLNPSGEACGQQLRPGFGAYLRWHNGPDLHLVSVHFDSGTKRKDYDNRQTVIGRVHEAFRAAYARVPDNDFVLAGDFNTMGCAGHGGCRPPIHPAGEVAQMQELLAKGSRAFRSVRPSLPCTEYYQGKGSRLDHFLVPADFEELPAGAQVHVSGYCEQTRCAASHDEPAAYNELSDHCPIVLELRNRDLD